MDPERLSTFLQSLDREDDPFISEIETFGRARGIPVARRETRAFLRTVIELISPRSILEIGTAIGCTAIAMAKYAPSAHVTTIELKKENFDMAAGFVSRAEEDGEIGAGRIRLIHGDAGEEFAALEGPYDLIFMDAAKGQYLNWLPDTLRLLSPGGVLVSDNVLQDGTILESRFAVERRDRTIHRRMREYLYALCSDRELSTSVLPLGDGVAFTVKKRRYDG